MSPPHHTEAKKTQLSHTFAAVHDHATAALGHPALCRSFLRDLPLVSTSFLCFCKPSRTFAFLAEDCKSL